MVDSNSKQQLELMGVVVSDKMDKTRVIEVRTRKTHPKYKKTYSVARRFVAHDEENTYKAGDTVIFTPARPRSKTKKFVIIGKK